MIWIKCWPLPTLKWPFVSSQDIRYRATAQIFMCQQTYYNINTLHSYYIYFNMWTWPRTFSSYSIVEYRSSIKTIPVCFGYSLYPCFLVLLIRLKKPIKIHIYAIGANGSKEDHDNGSGDNGERLLAPSLKYRFKPIPNAKRYTDAQICALRQTPTDLHFCSISIQFLRISFIYKLFQNWPDTISGHANVFGFQCSRVYAICAPNVSNIGAHACTANLAEYIAMILPKNQ